MYKCLLRVESAKRLTRVDAILGLLRSLTDRPPAPLSKVKITMIRHSAEMLDYQSLVRFTAWIVNALANEEIFVDDSWVTTGRWNVDQRYRDSSEGEMIEVLIQEMPDKRN